MAIARSTTRFTIAATLAVLIALPNIAQAAQQKSSTGKDAKEVISQPVRDVGIEKTKVPPLLERVGQAPYSMEGAGDCQQIADSIDDLSDELGADYVGPPGRQKKNIAKVGGAAVVNSLIPFRGLVREVSGAGPAERRLNAAIQAGIARRGFLRGLQRARGCAV